MDTNIISVNEPANVVSAVAPTAPTVITPEVSRLVSQYNGFLRKTAESIIGVAQTLVEAKKELDGLNFSIFCDEVGISENGSTFNKLIKIGENSARFLPFADSLPNTWTTLYRLATLGPDQFELVVKNLTPFITAKEIDEILAPPKTVLAKETPDITLSFSSLLVEQKSKIYAKILELKAEFRFAVKESEQLKGDLKAFLKQKSVAA